MSEVIQEKNCCRWLR